MSDGIYIIVAVRGMCLPQLSVVCYCCHFTPENTAAKTAFATSHQKELPRCITNYRVRVKEAFKSLTEDSTRSRKVISMILMTRMPTLKFGSDSPFILVEPLASHNFVSS
jgi:hypothetical protein